MLLKLQLCRNHLEDLLNTDAELHPQSFCVSNLRGEDLRIYTSNKFPSVADAVGWGTTLRSTALVQLISIKDISIHF